MVASFFEKKDRWAHHRSFSLIHLCSQLPFASGEELCG